MRPFYLHIQLTVFFFCLVVVHAIGLNYVVKARQYSPASKHMIRERRTYNWVLYVLYITYCQYSSANIR